MKMGNNKSLGVLGEEYASIFLKKKGYRILERNVRLRSGEIDIIAQDKEGTLVFIEVKTISGFFPDGFHPEDHMTLQKIKNFRNAASLYANARKNLVNDVFGFRLDLIALAQIGKDFVVHHYENVC